MKNHAYALRALALMLSYPDADVRGQLPATIDVLAESGMLSRSRLAELGTLVEQMQKMEPLAAECRYVETFDRGRSTCLHVFEHVHADSRDRGPAMVDLAQTYAQSGLHLDPDELPDHLCVILEFASTQQADVAQSFLGEMAHILQAIFSGLVKRQSPYAAVIAAVLECSGHKAQAVSIAVDEPLDESWQEPEAFGGCSNRGQAKPEQPQPIHFAKKSEYSKGVAA